jgi:E3 ubiquitin-protein ligase BAH
MRKYFPRETREKQKANDLERAIEIHGPNLPQESCCVM